MYIVCTYVFPVVSRALRMRRTWEAGRGAQTQRTRSTGLRSTLARTRSSRELSLRAGTLWTSKKRSNINKRTKNHRCLKRVCFFCCCYCRSDYVTSYFLAFSNDSREWTTIHDGYADWVSSPEMTSSLWATSPPSENQLVKILDRRRSEGWLFWCLALRNFSNRWGTSHHVSWTNSAATRTEPFFPLIKKKKSIYMSHSRGLPPILRTTGLIRMQLGCSMTTCSVFLWLPFLSVCTFFSSCSLETVTGTFLWWTSWRSRCWPGISGSSRRAGTAPCAWGWRSSAARCLVRFRLYTRKWKPVTKTQRHEPRNRNVSVLLHPGSQTRPKSSTDRMKWCRWITWSSSTTVTRRWSRWVLLHMDCSTTNIPVDKVCFSSHFNKNIYLYICYKYMYINW